MKLSFFLLLVLCILVIPAVTYATDGYSLAQSLGLVVLGTLGSAILIWVLLAWGISKGPWR